MKTKPYWVALLASAALIGQAQGGPHVEGRGFGGHIVGGRPRWIRWIGDQLK